MGGSSKTTESKQTATTQPQIPLYMQEPIQNYFSGIGNYQQADPAGFVAPVNDIQKAAFDNAGGLFGAGDAYGAAIRTAAGAAGNPLTAAATQGATADYSGQPRVANAASSGAGAASMMDGFSRYLDPTLGALVDTTLADFDVNSDRQKAAQKARYAGAGAFGGSRSAIGEGLLDAGLARARAATDAGLRSDAWRTAGGFAQYDASNRQNASQFTAAEANRAALANQAAANQRTLAQMQQDQFNAAQKQQQSQFQATQANALAAQQKDNELRAAQALAAIGGSAADTYRADLGAQLGAGNNLYALDSAATQAPVTQLQTIAGLLNPGLIDQGTGQIVTGEGTEYAKTSGGLLNGLLGIASLGVPFIPGYKG